jgi:hypothetical protein
VAFRFVADRIGTVADILQPFAAGVAIDQLDWAEAGDRRLGLLVGGADQPYITRKKHIMAVMKSAVAIFRHRRDGLVMVAMCMLDDDLVRVRVIVGSDRAHATTPANSGGPLGKPRLVEIAVDGDGQIERWLLGEFDVRRQLAECRAQASNSDCGP